MGQVTVTIDKREYAIVCEDGQEGHIVQLSKILDERARQLSAAMRGINENMLLALVGLTLADELRDIKDGLSCVRSEDIARDDTKLAQNIDAQTANVLNAIKDIKQA